MCERWRNDFAAFLADMGEKPGPGYSIDRIDNERGYEPGNCRWATPALQTLNRRCTRWLSLRGERVAVADASRRFGVRRCTIYGRLRSGWTEEEAVFGKVA